ncbi:MAG: hypothetical protein RBR78_10180 [Flavobacteriaceae bacterium]|jgi:FkbM family methyltransferase|nr:hypothetical protein [Flavobacteriaceae bacterium]
MKLHQEIIDKEYVKVLLDKEILEYFYLESVQISNFIKKYRIPYYFDIGCWYGILLNYVLKQNSSVQAIAVDAVKKFIDISQFNCYDLNRSHFYNFAIVPENIKDDTPFILNTIDTSKSGFDTIGVPIRDTKAIRFKEFIDFPNMKYMLNNSYLKLDLEGIDFDILKDIFNSNIKPKVIHFEVLKRTRNSLDEILQIIQSQGYSTQGISNPNHAFHSIICSEFESFVIGFKPFKLYTL